MKKITSSISKISNKSLALVGAAMLLSAVGCTSATEARCQAAADCAENNDDAIRDFDDCIAAAADADEFRASADAGCQDLFDAQDALSDCFDTNGTCDTDTGFISAGTACDAETTAVTDAATAAVEAELTCAPTP